MEIASNFEEGNSSASNRPFIFATVVWWDLRVEISIMSTPIDFLINKINVYMNTF